MAEQTAEELKVLKEAKLKKKKANWNMLLYLGCGMFGIGSFMMLGQSVPKDMPLSIVVFGGFFIGIALYNLYELKQEKK